MCPQTFIICSLPLSKLPVLPLLVSHGGCFTHLVERKKYTVFLRWTHSYFIQVSTQRKRTEKKTEKNKPKVLPSNGLLGMCRWMRLHFHDSTGYNGVAFSSIFNRVTRTGSHFFGTLRVRKSFAQKLLRWGL